MTCSDLAYFGLFGTFIFGFFIYRFIQDELTVFFCTIAIPVVMLIIMFIFFQIGWYLGLPLK